MPAGLYREHTGCYQSVASEIGYLAPTWTGGPEGAFMLVLQVLHSSVLESNPDFCRIFKCSRVESTCMIWLYSTKF